MTTAPTVSISSHDGTASKHNPINFHIDATKAYAIIGIFLFHYMGDLFEFRDGMTATVEVFRVASMDSLTLGFIGAFAAIGQGMANLFIICSGYGLYYSYASGSGFRLGDYAVKRFQRIAPLYWIALIFTSYTAVFILKVVNLKNSINPFISHFFFIHAYTRYLHYYGALWFIGYLVQLYLLFPLLTFIPGSRYRWHCLAAIIIVVAINERFPSFARWLPIQFLPEFVMSMIMAHMSLYESRLARKFIFNPWTAAVCMSLFISILFIKNITAPWTYYNTMFLLLFAALFPLSELLRRFRIPGMILAVLSFSSYAIYLFHTPIYRLILKGTSFMGGYAYTYPFLSFTTIFIVTAIMAYIAQSLTNSAIRHLTTLKQRFSH